MNDSINRRRFLKSSAHLAGTVALPQILPNNVMGAEDRTKPNHKITIGCIGVGGMGSANLSSFLGQTDCRVIAVCDVSGAARQKARDQVNAHYRDQGCAIIADWRELIARKDIDAVMIATPDHWHSLIATAAAKAGKDMYCEKPMGVSLTDGQAIRDAVRRHQRVFHSSVWGKDPANPIEAEFQQLIGGRFRNHPWEFEPASIRIENPAHPLNAAWAGKKTLQLPWKDELFQFDSPYSREKVRVLVSLDLTGITDKGQRPDKDYALAWIQKIGKGRSFYTAFGHNKNAFLDAGFLQFLQDGLQFALGDLAADTTPVPQPKVDLKNGFVPLFNGKDLTGWRGDAKYWSVDDGCITGITPKGGIAENNFLIWTGGEPAEFDLKLSYKLEGGNSGIYFHAKERSANSNTEMLVGPQADMSADHAWTGVVMEYLLRGKLAERGRKDLWTDKSERKDAGSVGDPKELLKAVRENDWNDYHVIVRNNLIVLRINDVVMSEVRDNDPRRALSGLLALQVHTGPPMKVQFKNVMLREWK